MEDLTPGANAPLLSRRKGSHRRRRSHRQRPSSLSSPRLSSSPSSSPSPLRSPSKHRAQRNPQPRQMHPMEQPLRRQRGSRHRWTTALLRARPSPLGSRPPLSRSRNKSRRPSRSSSRSSHSSSRSSLLLRSRSPQPYRSSRPPPRTSRQRRRNREGSSASRLGARVAAARVTTRRLYGDQPLSPRLQLKRMGLFKLRGSRSDKPHRSRRSSSRRSSRRSSNRFSSNNRHLSSNSSNSQHNSRCNRCNRCSSRCSSPPSKFRRT
mmetsp:Transcript_56907/g.133974  ORF Transcript_56907/g.133974 Transcript_56907/m.133974 type:complete len:264 (-) Transcript_56907:1306-2097(-)